jgi:hypothetical protein
MNELLKIYLQTSQDIPIKQLKKLDNNSLKTHFRANKDNIIYAMREKFQDYFNLFGKFIDDYDDIRYVIRNIEVSHNNTINYYVQKKLSNFFNLFYDNALKILKDLDNTGKYVKFFLNITKWTRPYENITDIEKIRNELLEYENYIDDSFVKLLLNYYINEEEYYRFSYIPYNIYKKYDYVYLDLPDDDIYSSLIYIPKEFINQNDKLKEIYDEIISLRTHRLIEWVRSNQIEKDAYLNDFKNLIDSLKENNNAKLSEDKWEDIKNLGIEKLKK